VASYPVFTPELLEAAAAKYTQEQGLRRAIERGEFELVFQPEISVETLKTALVEALIRWRTPERAQRRDADANRAIIRYLCSGGRPRGLQSGTQFHAAAYAGAAVHHHHITRSANLQWSREIEMFCFGQIEISASTQVMHQLPFSDDRRLRRLRSASDHSRPQRKWVWSRLVLPVHLRRVSRPCALLHVSGTARSTCHSPRTPSRRHASQPDRLFCSPH
jgi:hypothetical protein